MFRAERPGLAARAAGQPTAQMNGCHPGAGPQGYRPGRQNPAYDGPLMLFLLPYRFSLRLCFATAT